MRRSMHKVESLVYSKKEGTGWVACKWKSVCIWMKRLGMFRKRRGKIVCIWTRRLGMFRKRRRKMVCIWTRRLGMFRKRRGKMVYRTACRREHTHRERKRVNTALISSSRFWRGEPVGLWLA
jgi:hypothetical protein